MAGESVSVCENHKEPQKSYLLSINLKEGRGLVIRDRCGKTQNQHRHLQSIKESAFKNKE